MPKQKTDKPALTEADENLIRRVDAMMGAEPADGSTPLPSKGAKAAQKPVSAPELPKKATQPIPDKPTEPEEDDPNAEKPKKEKLLKIIDKPGPEPQKPAPEPEAIDPPKPPKPAKESQPKESSEPEATEVDVPDPEINLDDVQTDKAVDDIAAADADTILALQDLKNSQAAETVEPPAPSVGKRILLLVILAVVVTGGLILYGYTKL